MPATPSIDMEEMAANYGWSLAVLNSNKELKSVFNKAVAGTWSPARFVAAVRNTGWYKKHGEAARQSLILQKSDPKEYQRRTEQMKLHIRQMYGTMAGGQKMSDNWLGKTASQAITLGWTEEEIKHHIATATSYLGLMRQDKLGGQAGEAEQAIDKLTADYGIQVSDQWKAGRIREMMIGVDSIESVKQYMMKYAKTKYRAYADEIEQGLTVRDIAEPYMQSMAKTLELNPGSIGIFDSSIQKALTGYDPDSGKPTTKPVWQFEEEMRNDPRWTKTNNARESVMGVGHSLLQQFGLVS